MPTSWLPYRTTQTIKTKSVCLHDFDLPTRRPQQTSQKPRQKQPNPPTTCGTRVRPSGWEGASSARTGCPPILTFADRRAKSRLADGENRVPVAEYRYELRRGDEVVATGHPSREQPYEAGERVTIGGHTGTIRTVEPTLGRRELRVVVEVTKERLVADRYSVVLQLPPPTQDSTRDRCTRASRLVAPA